MDFKQSVAYLYSLGHEVLAAKFGLDGIRLLLERAGRPDRVYPSVIVAGTNGKGSVSAMLDSIARTAGRRTALYTSPHLVRITERIRVNGQEIGEADFARLATNVRDVAEALVGEARLASPPSFFEQVTAIALSYFAETAVELAILEVGLGGRLDSTNAVAAVLAVVTTIDMDHQQILGDTITKIAQEKAAVIKPGARAVIGRQLYEAATGVLMRRCLEAKVLPAFANEPHNLSSGETGRLAFDYESSKSVYSSVTLGLRGRHQADNAAAAIEAAETLNELGFDISREAIIKGLRATTWPGRLEWIDDRPALLLDGAHNAGGARALRVYLDEFWRGELTLIFAAMSDKDIHVMARSLFPAARTVVLTRVADPRSATGARIAQAALAGANNVFFTETPQQALSWARSVTPPDGLICVAGSLHLVGMVKRLLEEEDSQRRMLGEYRER
ncbi:MAG TPA: folylpolyglutamate synthase/dihydrofolate synthase family protein [Blastocatellia bacterium]|nr:folylpolyglutamate synthase/dihydrofolate synthase family protein [Blastocatellia bacterium]